MASDPPVLEVLLGVQSESTEDAHSNAWALPTPDLDTAAHDAFFKTANGAMKHIHAHYGSPYNYLKEQLKLGCGTPSDIAESLNLRNDFAHWMWTTFPEKEDQSYHHHGLIPSVILSEALRRISSISIVSGGYTARRFAVAFCFASCKVAHGGLLAFESS